MYSQCYAFTVMYDHTRIYSQGCAQVTGMAGRGSYSTVVRAAKGTEPVVSTA